MIDYELFAALMMSSFLDIVFSGDTGYHFLNSDLFDLTVHLTL